MTDDQRARTARVLDLLDQSHRAYARGDKDESRRLMAEAADLDAAAVVGVRGGMILGEIPNPELDPNAWADYIAAQRSLRQPTDDTREA